MHNISNLLICNPPSSRILDVIVKEYKINVNDKQALSAVCGAILNLTNCWNEDEEDPIGHLERCFDGIISDPFYARHKSYEGEAFEESYAQLHCADYAIATSSGEAAISLIVSALTQAGDTILVSESIFGTTKNNFKLIQNNDGRKVIFTELHNINSWEDNIKRNKPKLIFLESPSNPLAELGDIKTIKTLSEKYNSILVVDSTFAPAPIYKPLKIGSDIVIESATKFIDGQMRVTGGVLATNNKYWFEDLFKVRNAKGYNQVSFNALLLSHNMKSLEERVLLQSKNALKIALELEKSQYLTEVMYLGLNNHPQHSLAKQDFERCNDKIKGFGSIIGFKTIGDFDSTKKFGNATMIPVRANLGAISTILTHPISSTHSRSRLTQEDILAAGVTPNLLRLSVGIEEPDDILERIQQGVGKFKQ
uniref:O-succinylhomoserine sulfhydrylase n=1 Tax=Candidatus Kentrum eta TaxID=2126337 RepID=A0A450VAZ2_9GAMM|nr:MAG: O-succinylhomoserine sulfhydrylase [Candidatus Kentron sp. H]VFK01941.1 MAG: O-succinylhomoserine sulfhydrylase [Candidatus Kentron sp. H]VFK05245.1 MAG: O-succinylhomoserine sulfhydrylase [Candidatus Kentron sp. H]